MTISKSFSNTYLFKLSNLLINIDRQQIDNAVQVVADAWQAKKLIITLGNGGSSMTALHFVNDWNKSVYLSTKDHLEATH
jgi:D-sedoheptulose 7-phosphate isomerase